jgi:UDP-galactopyranose mutase
MLRKKMNENREVQVLVAGGGIAGLSAAYHMTLLGSRDYVVLEAEDEVGGIARSFQTDDGFTFDYGSHILYTKSNYVAQLYKQLLGDNFVECKRDAWIYSQGRFTRYPFQSNLYGLPLDVVEECLLGFFEALQKDQIQGDADFEMWVQSTYGAGIARHFMLPYNEKQWKYPLNQMSHHWVGNRVLRPNLKDLIHGALADSDKGFGPNQTFLYPRAGGTGVIPQGLFKLLGRDTGKVLTGKKITSIDYKKKSVMLSNGETYKYHKLIYTFPLRGLATIFTDSLPDEVQEAVDRLEYNRMYCLFFGVKGEPLTERMRLYLPGKEFLAHRLGFPQSITSSAPDGWGSVYAEITEARSDSNTMSEHEMVERTVADLRRINIINEDSKIEYKGRVVLDPAYVIYTLTHSADVEIIHRFLREHDIHPAGRYADWRYYNIDHSILSAKNVVEKIHGNKV